MTGWTRRIGLSKAQQQELISLWGKLGPSTLARRYGITRNAISGYKTRLNLHSPAKPETVKGIAATHPAAVEGRTLFPGRVVEPSSNTAPRRSAMQGGFVLISGANSTKLGRVVQKGAWRGMPIFSLALEERKTCPRTCGNWLLCYGNSSFLQKRMRHGSALEARLAHELAELQELHPTGFVVRLHVLGDFYSVAYVNRWKDWLNQFPALRVFGYTAWPPTTDIGETVEKLALAQWDRFAIRLSASSAGPRRTITLRSVPPADMWQELITEHQEPIQIISCPTQTGKTKSCATCGSCWAIGMQDKTIAFMAHGL
jgi:hypothetical protein